MKKILSLILVLCMFLCICIPAFADCDLKTKTLSFNSDGTFKIFVVNDIQDDENVEKQTVELLQTSLEMDRPDLVILNGDQLSDIEFNLGTSGYEKTIRTICDIIEKAEVPFLFTYGNHDNDKSLVFPISKQAKVYNSYNYCFAEKNGPDSGTYNKVIYASDGSGKAALNIYMMNTGAWDLEGWLSGVTPCQQSWYRNTRDALAKANGGIVPSVVFQHIPVKETYNVLKEVNPLTTPNAIRGNFFGTAYKAYVLDPDKLVKHPDGTPQSIEGKEAVFASAICSEHPLKYTGQYASWLEKDDVFAAFFAHDHKNNFISYTDDNVILAYNRGFGFATEGDGTLRGGRMLVFNEKNVKNFDFYNVCYEKYFDEPFEDTEGGIGFIANNLLQTIRAKIADTFFSFLYPKAS